MIVTENLTPNITATSLALGFFDGIHVAHQKVLCDAIDFSKKFNTKSVVLTYKNHPSEVIHSAKREFITMPEERIELFEKLGFDVVIIADFTKYVASLSQKDYLTNIILNLSPKTITVGYNHHFGANRGGDVMFLSENAVRYNYILSVVPPVKSGNTVVSSTHIKRLLKIGKVDEANKLLFKNFSIKNKVIHGMQRGRKIGFPTANIEFPPGKILISGGVYAGFTKINNKMHKSIANVGFRPTFNDIQTPLIEVNIFDFDVDIYDEIIEFEFIKKIRDEVSFSSIDSLKEQILADKNIAANILENYFQK